MVLMTIFEAARNLEEGIMTRTWIAMTSHTLRTTQPGTASRRPRRAGVRLERLETRLALSSYSAAPVPMDLNPQPLPPGIVIALNSGPAHPDLNPQPIPPGIKHAPSDLNPQPLPPGIVIALGKVAPASVSHTVAPFVTGTHVHSGTFSPDPTCPTCLGFA
jgi:hypothetical protein